MSIAMFSAFVESTAFIVSIVMSCVFVAPSELVAPVELCCSTCPGPSSRKILRPAVEVIPCSVVRSRRPPCWIRRVTITTTVV